MAHQVTPEIIAEPTAAAQDEAGSLRGPQGWLRYLVEERDLALRPFSSPGSDTWFLLGVVVAASLIALDCGPPRAVLVRHRGRLAVQRRHG